MEVYPRSRVLPLIGCVPVGPDAHLVRGLS